MSTARPGSEGLRQAAKSRTRVAFHQAQVSQPCPAVGSAQRLLRILEHLAADGQHSTQRSAAVRCWAGLRVVVREGGEVSTRLTARACSQAAGCPGTFCTATWDHPPRCCRRMDGRDVRDVGRWIGRRGAHGRRHVLGQVGTHGHGLRVSRVVRSSLARCGDDCGLCGITERVGKLLHGEAARRLS